MVFYRRLSDRKSPQVSGTLLSILTIFNNAVVWMVYIRLPTSKSSRPFNNHLVTVPKAPIRICMIATFMFHSFFQFSSNVEVLISLFTFLFFASFSILLVTNDILWHMSAINYPQLHRSLHLIQVDHSCAEVETASMCPPISISSIIITL